MRDWALLIAITALLTTTGCMGRLGEMSPPPQVAGPHAVGVVTQRVHDHERDRELEVEIWYPARTRGAARPAVYGVQALGGTVARLRSPLDARRGAEPLRSSGPRPLVLWSHGAASNRFANVSLAEVLASHGYVVAAPDHRGHTTADEMWGISELERAQAAYDRPIDLARVLDALLLRSRGADHVLAGLLDEGRIAVAGHSFGGRTALGLIGAEFDVARQQRECAAGVDDRNCHALPVFAPHATERYRFHDPRVSAALLVAPAGFEFYRADGVRQIDTPVLVVGARKDEITPFAERHQSLHDALVGAHYLLDLEDAGHLTATDVCDIVASIGWTAQVFGGREARDGCGDGFMSSRAALEIVAEASLAFLDLHLNRSEAARPRLEAALRAPRAGRVAVAGDAFAPGM